LARHARRLGIPVIYYISPQVWAWRRGRARRMRRWVSLMLVIFPFEESFYRRVGVPVRFVGHPLLDAHAAVEGRDWDWSASGLDPERPVILLLPGSRESEIRRLISPFLVAGSIVQRRHPEAQFVMVRAESLKPEALAWACAEAAYPVRIVEGPALPLLRRARVAITASGTATLDLALSGVPMVVAYRVSPLTYALARALVRVDHIGLVNIVAGRRLCPELIQGEMTPHRMAEEALALDEEGPRRREVLAGLSEVAARLGRPGASRRAALEILRFLAAGRAGRRP